MIRSLRKRLVTVTSAPHSNKIFAVANPNEFSDAPVTTNFLPVKSHRVTKGALMINCLIFPSMRYPKQSEGLALPF